MGLVIVGFIVFVVSFLLRGLDRQTSERVNYGPASWAMRVLGVLMIAGGAVWGSVVLVPAGHRGVLLRFSAVQGGLGEGLHVIMPGVQSVVVLEVRTQVEESTAASASRDLQVVSTRLAINFRIDPARVGDLYKNVGTEYKIRIIDPAVQESLKVVTAKYTAEDLIRNRSQVKAEVELEITRRLKAYNILVEPSGLSITNFDYSPEFIKAIEAKQVAQQEAEKQKYVLQQAELQKQTEIARAEGQSKAAMLNADALRAQGGGLVIAREWIEKWDGKLPSVSAGGSGAGGGFIIDLASLLKDPAGR